MVIFHLPRLALRSLGEVGPYRLAWSGRELFKLKTRVQIPVGSQAAFYSFRGGFFKIVWGGNGARSGYVNYITRCNLLQLGIEYKIWHQARNLEKT